MRRRLSIWLRAAAALVTFALGTAGYLKVFDGDWGAAMYSAVRVFTVNVDAARHEMNGLIQASIWLGVALTGSVLYSAGRAFFDWLNGRARAGRKDAVSLHGDAACLSALARQLGKRAVLSDESCLAKTHVLAFDSDERMLAYLGAHIDALRRADRAYLCALRIPASGLGTEGFIVRNMTQTCAREYWRAHHLSSGERAIALIGMGAYGSALLYQALLVNVFERGDTVCYHVFGDGADFRALHPGLDQFAAINAQTPDRDSIYFHAEPWRARRDVLAACDRVILCDDEGERNTRALCDIAGMLTRGRVYLRAAGGETLRALLPAKGLDIVPFGTAEELYSPENVLLDKMTEAGRRIDGRYMRNHVCLECWQDCLTCEKHRKSWNDMDAFTQNSNLAQADHMPVKLRILLRDRDRILDAAAVAEAKTAYEREKRGADRCDRLNAIEHERWMRYHYLHGWAYADIDNKDTQKRLHPCLLPYEQLPESDQIKDTDAWDMLFELPF